MSRELEQEKEFDITELVKDLSLEDELKLDNDIREWLQEPSIQLKEYGFKEVDREEGYYTLLNELSEFLMER